MGLGVIVVILNVVNEDIVDKSVSLSILLSTMPLCVYVNLKMENHLSHLLA